MTHVYISLTAVEDTSLKYWMSIMKLADQFNIPEAGKEARDTLERRVVPLEEDPIHIFELGRRYGIRSWCDYALRFFFSRNIMSFSPAEGERLGGRIMLAIAKVQRAVDDHKRLVALIPPSPLLHVPECDDVIACKKAYDHGWWMQAGRLIHDPDVRISCYMLYDKLGDFTFPGITHNCWLRTHKALDKSNNVFNGSYEISQKAIEKLLLSFDELPSL